MNDVNAKNNVKMKEKRNPSGRLIFFPIMILLQILINWNTNGSTKIGG
jgi:hypothetical protein